MQLIRPVPYIFFFLLIFLIRNVELSLSKKQFQIFVQKVASEIHRSWRKHYLSENPHVKNRFKLTHNATHYNSSDFIYPMILTVGSCLVHRNLKVARDRYNSSITYVDILNMDYDELPDDWAYENRASARVACTLVIRSIRQKRLFDANFIENLSDKVHEAWINRNKYRTSEEFLIPYGTLSEIEKAKDRRPILIACRLFNQLRLYQHFKATPIHLIEIYIE